MEIKSYIFGEEGTNMNKYDALNEVPLYRLLRKIKKLFVALLFVIFMISSIGLFFLLYLQSQPLLNTTIEQTTFIYSMDGLVLDVLHSGDNRVSVPLEQIPDALIKATVAIEDRKFYSHFGFDFIRIGGAIVQDIKHLSKVQGASTITQQLAKNLYLSNDKTIKRKLREALLAIQLELQFSKDKILEMYLNQIYFGHSANGVQMAAQTFFGKDVSELNLAESTMLAGIPKGPKYFSPFLDYDNAKSRQGSILKAMVSEHYITQEEAENAFNKPLTFKDPEDKVYATKAPYFRDYVISLLKNKYGITEEQIFQGGLKVYTTLDVKMQEDAEEMVTTHLPKDRSLQAALASIDPTTGYIKAMVGGRDYDISQYNRVFANRQPGSSFKPILYLAALEQGFTPVSQFKSEPTVFTFGNNQVYQPSNYGNRYPNREIDLRYALAHSDNIFAVKTHMDIGMDKLVDMSKKVGIEKVLLPYPSLALGSQEVTPFDMAKAYSTIANQGRKVEPSFILKIEDQNGNILYENKPKEEIQVVSPASTFVLTYLMEGVFEPGGTGFYIADRLKRPVAGKTGTTDYDAWLIGFTPQLVTSLWLGYDDNQPLVDGDSLIAKEIWADYMEKAHHNMAPQLFMVPDHVVSLYIDPESGKIAKDDCPNARLEFFVEGTAPTEYCESHQITDIPDSNNSTKETTPPSIWERFQYWWSH